MGMENPITSYFRARTIVRTLLYSVLQKRPLWGSASVGLGDHTSPCGLFLTFSGVVNLSLELFEAWARRFAPAKSILY